MQPHNASRIFDRRIAKVGPARDGLVTTNNSGRVKLTRAGLRYADTGLEWYCSRHLGKAFTFMETGEKRSAIKANRSATLVQFSKPGQRVTLEDFHMIDDGTADVVIVGPKGSRFRYSFDALNAWPKWIIRDFYQWLSAKRPRR